MAGLELLKEFYQGGMLFVINANALTFMAYSPYHRFRPLRHVIEPSWLGLLLLIVLLLPVIRVW